MGKRAVASPVEPACAASVAWHAARISQPGAPIGAKSRGSGRPLQLVDEPPRQNTVLAREAVSCSVIAKFWPSSGGVALSRGAASDVHSKPITQGAGEILCHGVAVLCWAQLASEPEPGKKIGVPLLQNGASTLGKSKTTANGWSASNETEPKNAE